MMHTTLQALLFIFAGLVGAGLLAFAVLACAVIQSVCAASKHRPDTDRWSREWEKEMKK